MVKVQLNRNKSGASMKKLLGITAAILLFSGCSLSSTYVIDSSGAVAGTTSFGVPKSAVRNVTTLDQWAKVLQDNNMPSPTPAPTESQSETPAPEASCSPGEDLVNAMWTYACSVSGDISALSDATNFSSISGQGGSSGLVITRAGTTVTITQPAVPASDDTSNGFLLKGISLIFTNSTLTFPGTVGPVTGGAVKIDEHTVSFSSDQGEAPAMTATVEIPSLPNTSTTMTLRSTVSPSTFADVGYELTAQLSTPRVGRVQFFDGDLKLPTAEVDSYGVAKLSGSSSGNGVAGHHVYRAIFVPTDWWNFDQSSAQSSSDISLFTVSRAITLTGSARVGGKLQVGSIASTPSPTKLSYQWFSNGKPIAGQTSQVHKVVAADANKTLTVRIILHKAGVVDRIVISKPVKVAKK